MQEIFCKKKLIGVKLDKIPAGSVPQTPGEWALQLVTLKHPRGTSLAAHYHRPRPRRTSGLQECLYVRKGRVRLNLYGPDNKFCKRIFLAAGQAFITVTGGIGIYFLAESELLEFKNGPFREDKVPISAKP